MSRPFRYWSRFSGWVLSVPLRVKIMGIVLGVVFMLASVVIGQVLATMKARMREELQQRGISVARDVAGRAANFLVTDNLFAVNELVKERISGDRDVRYVVVLDQSGNVLADTFGRGVPPGLLPPHSSPPEREYTVEVLETEEGLVWDAAVPILEGMLGTVRVGMSERHLQSVVASTTRFLVLVTVCLSLAGMVAAYLLTAVMTKPVLDLVKMTEAVIEGNLQQKPAIWAKDEVGRLGVAFNAMIGALARSRHEIEEFNRQLLRRNEELTVLNAISMTVGGSLDFEHILDGALGKVLEMLKFKAAWVVLRESDHRRLTLAVSRGLSEPYQREEAENDLRSCVCQQVMESGEPQIVDDILKCPRLSHEVLQHEGLKAHVSVPLKAKDNVLGIMNVAWSADRSFTPDDMRLLKSVGHQIGMVVENARLYEELRHKELLRRRLLDKLIRAQEEERKRVARELHDQIGQSLTAVIMALGSAEEMMPAQNRRLKDHLAKIGTLASGIVEDVRRLIFDLRPSLLDDLGLVSAIRSYAEARLPPAGVEPHIEVVGRRRKLPSHLDIAIFRVIQEAVTNIIKHAQASNATIRFRFNPSSVAAAVEDDGKGFDAEEPSLKNTAFGLLGMEERVTLFGGKLGVDSQPGRGTRVALEIPIPAE